MQLTENLDVGGALVMRHTDSNFLTRMLFKDTVPTI